MELGGACISPWTRVSTAAAAMGRASGRGDENTGFSRSSMIPGRLGKSRLLPPNTITSQRKRQRQPQRAAADEAID